MFCRQCGAEIEENASFCNRLVWWIRVYDFTYAFVFMDDKTNYKNSKEIGW